MLKLDVHELECFSGYMTDYEACKFLGSGIAHVRRLALSNKLRAVEISFGATSVLLLHKESVEAYARDVCRGRPSFKPPKLEAPL